MKQLISVIFILILSIQCYGFTTITGNHIDDDKVMHWEMGWGTQAIFESWGYSTQEARIMVLICALSKETYDRYAGDRQFDVEDVLATMLGSFSWEIAKGVNFKVIVR